MAKIKLRIQPEPDNLFLLIAQERSAYVLKYLDTLDLKKGARILDLGCGAGETSVNLLQRGFIVTGIDTSEEKLDIARKNSTQAGLEKNATFQSGDAENLDLQDDSFDVVIAIGLIEDIMWDRWVFQEIHRVVIPDGYVIVTATNNIGLSNITNPFHLISNFKEILGSIFQKNFMAPSRSMQKSPNSVYRNFYIPSRFRHMLSELDFDIIDSLSHGFGPFIILNRSRRLSVKIYNVLNHYRERKKIPYLSELGNDYIVLCKKRENSSEITRRYIIENIDRRIKLFKSENKDFFSRRNAWVKENPEYSHLDLHQFETLAYSRENVLVISPHPDDEIIGCGGTLIKMLAEGSIVTVLQLTDGSSTYALKDSPERAKKTIRLEEAKIVAEKLGINELILLKEDQSHFKCTENMVKKLSEILLRLNPKVIFIPFMNDRHPDHVAANTILCKALEVSNLNLSEVNILSYEVWSLVPPNSFCIINDQFHKKAKMLMHYRTGMKVVDYVHFCEDLNAYHSYNLLGIKGFAEVFLNLNAKTYLKLFRGSNIT